MTGLQYEALCRHAISQLYAIPITDIHSGHLPGVVSRGNHTRHQIDLHWDVSDGVFAYRVFANAKWRAQNLDLEDVMHTIGVWRDIAAHKAILITNTGFDPGVIKQAEEKGIGLLLVRPAVDLTHLGRKRVTWVLDQIERLAANCESPVFAAEVVHKGSATGCEAGEMADRGSPNLDCATGVKREDVKRDEESGESATRAPHVANKLMGGLRRKA